MRIIKCDSCKKEIKLEELKKISINKNKFELCKNCVDKIIKMIKENKYE